MKTADGKDVDPKLPANYCGSCYGAEKEPGQCCNTCQEVQEAYRSKGWAFGGADAIEQVTDSSIFMIKYTDFIFFFFFLV